MKKFNIKSVLSLPCLLTVVLFALAITSSYISMEYRAKYATRARNDNSTKVARFDVQMTAVSEKDATVLNGLTNQDKILDSKSYGFSVTNNSEVGVEYDINIHFSKSLPDGIVPTVRIGNKADVIGTTDDERKVFSFTSPDFVFSAENKTNRHTLTVTVNYYDENNFLSEVSLKDTEVKISVIAGQVN